MPDYLHQPDPGLGPDIAAIYDEASLWAARFGLLLLDHLPLQPGQRILDLACGTGFPLFELAHVCGPTCRLTGVDLWPAGLARAQARRRTYGLAGLGLVQADGARLPFPPATFDLVVSNLGINNFADPAAVLAETARVLRPGGRLALTTNVVGHMQEFYAVFRAVLAERGRPDELAALARNEGHRGTPDSVRALLTAAGFQIAAEHQAEFTLRYLDGSALFRHSLTRLGFLAGWRAVVDPAAEDAVFTALETRLNAQARAAGGLRLTVPMLYIEGRKPGG